MIRLEQGRPAIVRKQVKKALHYSETPIGGPADLAKWKVERAKIDAETSWDTGVKAPKLRASAIKAFDAAGDNHYHERPFQHIDTLLEQVEAEVYTAPKLPFWSRVKASVIKFINSAFPSN